MTPRVRRVTQAILYEAGAIAFVGPVLSVVFEEPTTFAMGLALVLSGVALAWNDVFNAIFERWERHRSRRSRSLATRLVHGFGLEGGLAVILVPIMSLWLNTSASKAFAANLGLLVFFFVYAVAFTWAFDRVFGLPQSLVGAGRSNDQVAH